MFWLFSKPQVQVPRETIARRAWVAQGLLVAGFRWYKLFGALFYGTICQTSGLCSWNQHSWYITWYIAPEWTYTLVYIQICVCICIMNMLPCMYFKFVLWLGIPALLVAKFLRTVLHLEEKTSHDGCLPREILGHDSTITLVEVMLQSNRSSSASGNLPICISEPFIFPCSLPESTLKIGAWKMKIPFGSQAPAEDGEGSNEARSEEKGNKNHRDLGQTSCVLFCPSWAV